MHSLSFTRHPTNYRVAIHLFLFNQHYMVYVYIFPKTHNFGKIRPFNWRITVAEGQNMAILIIGQGKYEFA